jgi:hypothetical protein
MSNGTAIDKIREAIEAGKQDAAQKQAEKDRLERDSKEKQAELQRELDKPERERDESTIKRLVSDIAGINQALAGLKGALEEVNETLPALLEVLEQLKDLGETAADLLISALKELIVLVKDLTEIVTDLIKEASKLVKLVLILTIIVPVLQEVFDIKIAGSFTIQPLALEPVSELASVTKSDALLLANIGINTLGDLASANLIDLQGGKVDVARVAQLKGQASLAVRPFTDDVLYLIEELDVSLLDVAQRSDDEFRLPANRVRAVRADILSRAAVLKPRALKRLRVTDLIDIKVSAEALT